MTGEVSYKIREFIINALAYADGNVLTASTLVGLQKDLNILARELKLVGLNLNPAKCAVLSLKPGGHLKKIKNLNREAMHGG